jgi:hypothetical protein
MMTTRFEEMDTLAAVSQSRVAAAPCRWLDDERWLVAFGIIGMKAT